MACEVKIEAETANDDVVLLRSWSVKDGDHVEVNQEICEVETSKASHDVVSPCEGTIRILAAPGEVGIGVVLAVIGTAEEVAGFAPTAPRAEARPTALGSTRVSRAARELMERHGVTDADLPDRPFIRAEDVLAHLRTRAGSSREGQVSPLPFRKKEEIRSLRSGHAEALPSTLFHSLAVPRLAERLDELSVRANVSVSAVTVAALGRVLREFPDLNAAYADDGILRYTNVNIGVAFDIGDHGLRIAVVRNADGRDLVDIALALQALLMRYVEDGLTEEDVSGGTFTLTDLSMYDIPYFVPLLGRSQSAILGLGLDRTRDETPLLTFSLTFDHRVTEGRRAAIFLGKLRSEVGRLLGGLVADSAT